MTLARKDCQEHRGKPFNMQRFSRKLLDRLIAFFIVPSLKRQGLYSESLIRKASRFAACEVLTGDYLEFGVYRGKSLIDAYRSLEAAYRSRSSQDFGNDAEANERRREAWRRMRFFAFDSFQGLPPLQADDLGTADFKQGQLVCDLNSVKQALSAAGIPGNRAHFVSGWFSETCTRHTADALGIEKACIVWIDADLYSSARDVLNFVENFLQDGTIIVFDDWFSYRGNPACGEQRAFYEWLQKPSINGKYIIREYGRESWKRMAFIVNTRNRTQLVQA